jgi:hypothetical protein
MAGQERQGSPRRERSSRAGSSRRTAAASAGAHGGARIPATQAATPTTVGPATAATHRALVRGGLTPDEAADLTAFLVGIPLREVHWSLAQVNRLLFLKRLHQTGRIGADDMIAPVP